MICVKTARLSVRLNGKLLEKFVPTRGLRQGDPLSPYLFLLVGEGLCTLFKHQILQQWLQELTICRKAPGISHLMFADDTLIFFKANEDQANKINQLLRNYEEVLDSF